MHDGADPLNTPEIAQPRRHKGIYVLPNMITLAALFSGFYAVVMSMNGRYDLATVGIFVAMVLDSLDGRVARLTHTQSAFGEQMDSLSDMVSFGAAPALIAYEWALRDLGRWGWIAAFVYCACAATPAWSTSAISRACRRRRPPRWSRASSGWRPRPATMARAWPGRCSRSRSTPA